MTGMPATRVTEWQMLQFSLAQPCSFWFLLGLGCFILGICTCVQYVGHAQLCSGSRVGMAVGGGPGLA